jgi:hypothetical protein
MAETHPEQGDPFTDRLNYVSSMINGVGYETESAASNPRAWLVRTILSEFPVMDHCVTSARTSWTSAP